jgi:hypothetical protein
MIDIERFRKLSEFAPTAGLATIPDWAISEVLEMTPPPAVITGDTDLRYIDTARRNRKARTTIASSNTN